MNDYRKTQTSHDIARFFGGLIVVGFLFALSTVAVQAAYGMYQTFTLAAAEATSAEMELSALKDQQVQVETTLAALGTARGVEEAVRERFGVARPGEGEIRIVRDQGDKGATQATTNSNPFLQFFQSLFVW